MTEHLGAVLTDKTDMQRKATIPVAQIGAGQEYACSDTMLNTYMAETEDE